MNWVSGFTAAVFTGFGVASASGAIPAKYAGYAAIAGAMIQAFQGAVHKAPNASVQPNSSLTPIDRVG